MIKIKDIKTYVPTLVLALFTIACFAQTPNFENTQLVNGYEKTISGNDFNYYSSVPEAKQCLLVRVNDGNSTMEGETEMVETKIDVETVTNFFKLRF